MNPLLFDVAGRRRSPATLPSYHRGRSPRNKGLRYPADPSLAPLLTAHLVAPEAKSVAMVLLLFVGKCGERCLTGGSDVLSASIPISSGERTGPVCSATPEPSDPGAIVHYAPWISPPATLLMWFQLRSPELAEDFERLMAEDRDIVSGSLDTMSDWRLTRPADVPGQAIGQADYVLIAEIAEVDRWEQQASEHVQRLADDLSHLVSSRGMLVVRPVL